MNAQQLREQAMHYKRVAALVSDSVVAQTLIELAAEYEALADKIILEDKPTPGAANQ